MAVKKFSAYLGVLHVLFDENQIQRLVEKGILRKCNDPDSPVRREHYHLTQFAGHRSETFDVALDFSSHVEGEPDDKVDEMIAAAIRKGKAA